jgi:diphthamide synthase (EF-2-diphthine--ammonia ligase)
VAAVAFGDLYLADVRTYRERLVEAAGLRAIFPLWDRPTAALAEVFIGSGFRAILACVDPTRIDVSHCGREFDASLIEALPPSADPCGENGEFHTFVYDAPMFGWPIDARRGQIVERDGFVFCDLLPRDGERASSGDVPRGGMARA